MDTIDSSYQTVPVMSPGTPLFGGTERTFGVQRSSGGQLINIMVGFITAFVVLFTMISAFVVEGHAGRGLNITFAFIIAMTCASNLLLILWYRQGDVDTKFKKLIYFNALCITLLCICANIYFHGL